VPADQEGGQVSAHPAKHHTPSAASESGDSERKRFVAACLEANSNLTIKAIQEQAMHAGLHISVGAISEYRKQFFVAVKGREITVPGHVECDTVESVSSMTSEAFITSLK
jgi:hypothetical protein